jgi:hypothetical protein
MRIDDNDIPHIQVECSQCCFRFIFDLRHGTDCPACHHIGVRWARMVTGQEAQEAQDYGSEARTRLRNALDAKIDAWAARSTPDYPGRLSSPYAHTAGEEQDIAELDRMFAMEDTRR